MAAGGGRGLVCGTIGQYAGQSGKSAQKGQDQRDLLYVKAKIVSLEEFRARSEILDRKEKIIKDVLRQARQEFYALPTHEHYPMTLKRLILDALRRLEGEGDEFICRVNTNDGALLSLSDIESLGKKLGKVLSLDSTFVDITGGAIVYRSDLRLLYDNSLEAIFERKTQLMRCIVAEYIFGLNGKENPHG